MKKSVSAAFVLLLAAALAAQSGSRHGGPLAGFGGFPGGKGAISAACVDALALTDAQEASLETLRQELGTAVGSLIEQRRSYHEQIEAALEAANPDPTAIGRLVIADHGVAEQIRSAHDRFETRFQALLTPEQLANYTALRDNGVCAPRRKGPR